MTQQFTASEVRELAATIWPDLSGREEVSETLNAYADLLEAQERAVPVVTRESAINAIEHVGRYNGPGRETEARQMLVEGSPSVAHRAPSDAERLAEALRKIAEFDCGCVPCVGECRKGRAAEIELQARMEIAQEALGAHHAQAQPPAASVTVDAVMRVIDRQRRFPYCSIDEKQAFRNELEAAIAAQENPNG